MSSLFRKTVTVLMVITLAFSLNAKVKLANIFCSNGVIQYGKPVPIWGLATPGEKVKIKIHGVNGCMIKQNHDAIADRQGKWVVTLEPLKAGDQFHIFVQGENSKTGGYNIKAGDVWFYAGGYRHRYLRSIPQITMKGWAKENKDLFPLLRIYGTNKINTILQRQENGRWGGPTADVIFGFTPGIADHFAIELCRDKKIPVGVVHVASLNGHWIDKYLSAEDFVKDPILGKTEDAKKLSYRVGGTKECKKINAERIAYMETYLAKSIEKNSKNKIVENPNFPQFPKWAETKTSMLYNGAIHPLLPLAVKGVIYNDPNGPKPFNFKNHGAKFELLVKLFRKWFNDPELPVFIMQGKGSRSQRMHRCKIRYAMQQKIAQKDKNVEIVVTNDIETDDLLLKTIPAKGHRVYELAKRKVYGDKSVKSETPQITGFKSENGKIVITFSMPLQTFNGLAPDGFAVKAKGKSIYRVANAELKGNTIILTAPGIKEPEHANYCYVNNAIKKSPNVIGENKMPVSAFSTELLNGDK